MVLDPAPGPGKPFLPQPGMMVARVVPENIAQQPAALNDATPFDGLWSLRGTPDMRTDASGAVSTRMTSLRKWGVHRSSPG